MPDPIKLILRHAALGGLIAVGFVALLLWLNVGNLWHLVTHTSEGPLALAVLTAFCTITFGSVQIGIRIMAMAEDQESGGGGKRAPQAVAVPIAVIARDERRR